LSERLSQLTKPEFPVQSLNKQQSSIWKSPLAKGHVVPARSLKSEDDVENLIQLAGHNAPGFIPGGVMVNMECPEMEAGGSHMTMPRHINRCLLRSNSPSMVLLCFPYHCTLMISNYVNLKPVEGL
jgi:hypothetical protein